MSSAGDIVKRVRTQFVADTKDIGRAAAMVKLKFRTVTGAIDGMVRSTDNAIGRVLNLQNVMAVAMGGVVVKSITMAGTAAQDTELALASLFQSADKAAGVGAKSWQEYRKLAVGARAEARALTRDMPGTSEDILRSLKETTFFLTQAGMTRSAQLGFSSDVAAREKIENLQSGVIAKDVRQILGGQGSMNQIQSAVLKGIAKQAAELAREGQMKAAVNMILERIGLSAEERADQGASVSGLAGTVRDQILQLKETAAGPVLDFVTDRLRAANEWLTKNRGEAERIARQIGEGIVTGLRMAESLARFLSDHWGKIALVIGGIKLAGMVSSMAQLVARAREFAAAMAVTVGGGGFAAGAMGAAGALAKRAGLVGLAAGAGALIGNALTDRFQFGSVLHGTGKDRMSAETRAKLIQEHAARRRKAARSALDEEFEVADPEETKDGKKKRKGKQLLIRKAFLHIQEATFRTEDFARLSAAMPTGFQQRVQGPAAGLGLGLAAVGAR